jgi:hypothetical protein
MTMQTRKDPVELRERLAVIAQRFSQSEISRRTATPVSSVNRYLNGVRIPGEFCTALVRGLGVNPAWLLAGEGAPWLAEVRGETGRMAGDLLELVEAMNAVSRMKLGSLAGKPQMRMLRELSDALVTFDELRGRIDDQSRPIFRQILKDWRDSLFKHDADKADALAKAALQVSRLCHDETLAIDYASVAAHHAWSENDAARAVHLQRRALLSSLATGDFPTETSLAEARRFCVELSNAHRTRESMRYARAFLELARDKASRTESYAVFRSFYGLLRILNGHADDGVRIVRSALPQMSEIARATGEGVLLLGLYLSGVLTFEGARAMSNNEAKAETLQMFALWECRLDALEAANAAWHRVARKQSRGTRYETGLIDCMVKALGGEVAQAELAFRKLEGSHDATGVQNTGAIAIMQIDHAQLLCASRRMADAGREHARAQKLVDALPKDYELPLFNQAIHQHNGLRCGNVDQRKAAKSWFRRMAKRGSGVFASLG